jgi:hypothetical protein
MLFLTHEEFSLQTHFTPDQVRQILANEIEDDEASLIWNVQTTIQAEGSTTTEYKFDTIPRDYRKHRTMIDGKVLCRNGITEVDVTVRPHFSLILISVLFFSFLGFLVLTSALAWFDESSVYFSRDIFTFLALLLLADLLVIGVFKIEVLLKKRWLKAILHVDRI